MKKSETTKCLQLVREAYSNQVKNDETESYLGRLAETWFECLRDLEYSDVKNAIYELIKTSKYMPTIAEIREKAGIKRYLRDGTYILDGLHYMN